MLGSKGVALIQELLRSNFLPPFNDDVMRLVTEEIHSLDSSIVEALQHCQQHPEDAVRPEFAARIMIFHSALQRNKRIAFAYLMQRIQRIKNMAWELGYVPERVKPSMTNSEAEFFNSYTNLVRQYSKQFDTANLTLDLADFHEPPTELYVEVRVLKDMGVIVTEEGQIMLQKDTQHVLRRENAEQYIRQGKLEHKTDI